MKVVPSGEVARKQVEMEGTQGVGVRELITDRDGAPNFAMRVFDVEPGGHTPLHEHPWEHEVYVLAGAGELRGGETPQPFSVGDAIYVPGGERHQFVNTGGEALRFL